MIIKSTRVPTTGKHRALIDHLFRGTENAAIEKLWCHETDVHEMIADAKKRGDVYAIRHFIIAPERATSREDAEVIIRDLGREFGFEPNFCVWIEHTKARATDAAAETHWHLLAYDRDPFSGRIIDTSNNFARNEKVARIHEHRLGHSLIHGKHHRSVVAQLRREGRNDVADALDVAFPEEAPRPKEAFSSDQHAMASRNGIDLPWLKQAVKQAWAETTTRRNFELEAARLGLTVRTGDRRQVYLVEAKDGTLIGALHRLLGLKPAVVAARMESDEDASSYEPPGQPDRAANPDEDRPIVGVDPASGGNGEPKRQPGDRRADDIRGLGGDVEPNRGWSDSAPRQDREASRAHRGSEDRQDRGIGHAALEKRLAVGLLPWREVIRTSRRRAQELAKSPQDRFNTALAAMARRWDRVEEFKLQEPLPPPRLKKLRDTHKACALEMNEIKLRHRGLTSTMQSLEGLLARPEPIMRKMFGSDKPGLQEQFDAAHAEREAVSTRMGDLQSELSRIKNEIDAIEIGHGNKVTSFQLTLANAQRQVEDYPVVVNMARALVTNHPFLLYIGYVNVVALIHMIMDQAGRPSLKPAKGSPDYRSRTDIWGIGQLAPPR